jgi:ABC-type amino acid transport substrate-binding protein
MRELGGKYLCAAFVALTMLMTGFFTSTASAGVLDRISQEKAIRIAYREDAPPFSYKDKIGEPVGFMVDLCREVAKKLADQLQLASLNVVYVPVTAADRFEAIRQQEADLLCEPTSATLSRREIVGFSIPTFVDGASLMIRADGPHDLKAMAGQEDRSAGRHDDRGIAAEFAQGGGNSQRHRSRQNSRRGRVDARRRQDLRLFRGPLYSGVPDQGQQGTRQADVGRELSLG